MNEKKHIQCKGIINTCLKMESSGINQGTSGNLSIRYNKGFLITPSSLPYNEMKPEDIVEMNWNGEFVGKQPSSEWRFHRDILKNRNDINVVLHCHSMLLFHQVAGCSLAYNSSWLISTPIVQLHLSACSTLCNLVSLTGATFSLACH